MFVIFYFKADASTDKPERTELLVSPAYFLFKSPFHANPYSRVPRTNVAALLQNSKVGGYRFFFFTPALFFLGTNFESNYWFNNHTLLMLQANESLPLISNTNTLLRNNSLYGVNGGSKWRGTFNSKLLLEIDLLSNPYCFSNPQHATSKMLSYYFSEVDPETFLDVLGGRRAAGWQNLFAEPDFFNLRVRGHSAAAAF